MKYQMKFLLLTAFIFVFLEPIFSQAENVRLYADSRIKMQVSLQSEIEADDFLYSVLLASGASEEEIASYSSMLNSLCEEIVPSLVTCADEEEAADRLLVFIYDKLLSKYNISQTRVDTAVETGVYNCVSSALIFMFFAKKAGIPVVAVETPAHAFCTIVSGGSFIDVETTNPYGVNPGKKRNIETVRGKGYLTVPPKNYVGRRNVDDRRAVCMVYDNRISYLQKQRKDFETVGLAVDASVIQGKSAHSMSVLSKCILNCGAEFNKKGRFREGLEFVGRAEKLFGGSEAFTSYEQATWHNLILSAIKKSTLEESVSQLEENREQLLPEDYSELKEFVFLWNCQNAAQKRDWPLSIEIAGRGLELFPQSKRLKNLMGNCCQNYAVDFHNRAADLFNAGKKSEALATVEDGLRIFPENKILLQDLRQMN